jgi:hypothetical protein
MKKDRENRIDNYFLNGLDDLNIIPPADVWNNIAGRLPSKTKNRSMFVWIALAASFALFALVGGWLYYQNQEMNSEISTQLASESSNQKSLTESKSIAAVNDDNTISKQEITEDRSNGNSDTSSQNLALVNSSKSPVIEDKSISQNSEKQNSRIVAAQSVHEKLNNTNDKTNTGGESIYNSNSEVVSVYPETQTTETQTEDTNTRGGKGYENSFALLSPIAAQNIAAPLKSTIISPTPSKIVIDTMPAYESLYAYENIEEEKEKKDRWAIGGQMAPLYSYRNLKEVSAYGLPKSEINEIEKGVVTYSSGIVVDFEASSRLTFQTGLNYMKWGQEIDNISSHDLSLMKSAYVPSNPKGKGLPVVNSAGVIYDESSVSSFSAPMPIAGANAMNADFGPGNMPLEPVNLEYKDIKQSFEFLEVPFLAKYKIINRKVNVHLLGGLSTHFLINDKSIIVTDNNVTSEGVTKKVETVNYSSSVGFGVAYNVNKHIKFSVEPTFKYYLNSFNSDNNVRMHPYTFGLYSGLLFRF